VLDISCNSGFWSVQCALLGADVVGFDFREQNIEQANLIKDIVGLDNVEFRVLDFWDMSPQALGGTFDVVLNLGLLYHLPSTLEALALTKSMSRSSILLDTSLHRSENAVLKLRWEEPHDIQMAGQSGVVEVPSSRAIDLMWKHLGVAAAFRIPNRSRDLPPDYLALRRASWLITV
jgi:SAM-dependent methyltransferase